MIEQYILDENRNLKKVTIREWGEWLETADRKVARDSVGDSIVSTVFIGLGPPRDMFETMVFGGKMDQNQWRWPTWDLAVKGHKEIVKKVLEANAN